ncbi:MAG: YeeE/YedE family protein [Myxococcota bacterium]
MLPNVFTPCASTLGGLLIGTSAVLMLALLGRIAGVSGIVGGLLSAHPRDRSWRGAFALGLLVGGFVLAASFPAQFAPVPGHGVGRLVLAGLLVGVGTRLGGGCTSGHGVCGLSRLSKRSLVATATFMGVAMLTVAVAGGAA